MHGNPSIPNPQFKTKFPQDISWAFCLTLICTESLPQSISLDRSWFWRCARVVSMVFLSSSNATAWSWNETGCLYEFLILLLELWAVVVLFRWETLAHAPKCLSLPATGWFQYFICFISSRRRELGEVGVPFPPHFSPLSHVVTTRSLLHTFALLFSFWMSVLQNAGIKAKVFFLPSPPLPLSRSLSPGQQFSSMRKKSTNLVGFDLGE